MPTVVTRTEYATFSTWGSLPAVPLNTPGWECTNYESLYDAAAMVGANRPRPGLPGRLAMGREIDEWQVSLRITVLGQQDHEGTAYDDAREGMRENLLFLRTNLLVDTDARPFEFHQFNGDVLEGDVQVVPPMSPVFAGPAAARIVLNLIVPAGSLTLSGS